MAFEDLTFSKSWERAEDFPTYEPDEKQVRADMQFLYNEVRDFINKKLVALLNEGGAAHITTSEGKDVESVLDELRGLVDRIAGGTVPEEGTALSWDLNTGGHRITNVAEPVDGTDAVNLDVLNHTVASAGKKYVTASFYAGKSAPDDVRLFWIDTNEGGGLKYYDGIAWSPVPFAAT